MQSSLSFCAWSLALCALVVYFWVRPLWARYCATTSAFQSKDFLPPAPSDRMHRAKLRLTRFLVWMLAGRMEVHGHEHLDRMAVGEPFILAPNHSHIADIFIGPVLMSRWKARFMAAPAVMKWFGGAFGFLAGSMGTFMASRKAGVEVLSTGQCLLLFPEGWVNLDGVMSRCKSGIVSISKEAEANIGRPVYIVPVYMHFGKYPGSWITKRGMFLQLMFMLSTFWYFRRGVKIVIGSPISSDTLPSNYSVAAQLVAERISGLNPARQRC